MTKTCWDAWVIRLCSVCAVVFIWDVSIECNCSLRDRSSRQKKEVFLLSKQKESHLLVDVFVVWLFFQHIDSLIRRQDWDETLVLSFETSDANESRVNQLVINPYDPRNRIWRICSDVPCSQAYSVVGLDSLTGNFKMSISLKDSFNVFSSCLRPIMFITVEMRSHWSWEFEATSVVRVGSKEPLVSCDWSVDDSYSHDAKIVGKFYLPKGRL